MKKFYLTTAIDYANGHPHLGHAYEKILADAICRVHRLQGDDVHFLTGLDEHGQKVQQTAESQNITPQTLCDRVADEFIAMCQSLHIAYDDYIRTTQPRHERVVREILQKLYDQGEIYQAQYTGFYSARVERFLQEKDKVDGVWPELEFGEVTEITETNYFFRLQKHKTWLIEYIEKHPNFIFPQFRAKQVLEFLKGEINDLCISRPKNRLSWGIELPFDSEYVTYVWFDALVNYISAVGYGTDRFKEYWPVDAHVIGKDILVPAHAIYWTMMLHALDLPMPKCFLTHGWWLSNGDKMSKSVGNVVNPMDYIQRFGPDAFRYFVLREMNVGHDSNFSHNLFMSRYNDDLGNDFGNLISRCLNMLTRYCGRHVPEVKKITILEKELINSWESTCDRVLSEYRQLQFNTALEILFGFIRSINRYLEQRMPWKLAKSSATEDQEMLATCLATTVEAIRLATTLLAPIMPAVAEQVLKIFRIDTLVWGNALNWDHSSLAHTEIAAEALILFPRKD
ncbi:MAG: methionine--tRNA ligase [Verrucomicrobiota bacterium]|nr:MAG: methionine--tRNA ligase [Verrucomicrobiota bacterium]